MFNGERLLATRHTANLDDHVSVRMTAGGPNIPQDDGVARDLGRATSRTHINRTLVNDEQDTSTGYIETERLIITVI